MFERHDAGEQAILVHVDFPQENNRENLQEFEMLVTSAGVSVLDVVTTSRSTPNPRFFIGSGKAEELAAVVNAQQADVIIFNHALSPSQERNLEKECQCRVLDRTTLILDIFAQRARTHEGKLQVELAQLKHMSTRLIRGWTHLERQKGGIGLRGPGETQLETDRRLLRERMKSIQKRLEKVSKQRQQGRKARHKAEIPTLSLVGYTNAGKSTLFNALTKASVYAADQLFATLDPTLRKIPLQDVGAAILADTVGFIRHLPHDLVAAFKATLQETQEAELLLHVIDVSDPRRDENIDQVNMVLEEIEADQVPQLLIYNKIDNLDKSQARIQCDEHDKPEAVWVSAKENQGMELILSALKDLLGKKMVRFQLRIPPIEGSLRGTLYQMNCISSENYSDDGDWLVDVKMPDADWQRLNKHHNQRLNKFIIE